MGNVLSPTVGFESDQGVIMPNQMLYWSPLSDFNEAQNDYIGQLGTNLMKPFIDNPNLASYTYTLKNGKHITLTQNIYPNGNHELIINLEDSLFTNMTWMNANGVLNDGLWICINPYTGEIDDITAWRLMTHRTSLNPTNPNNFLYYGFPGAVEADYSPTFRGSEEENLDDATQPSGGTFLMDVDSDDIPFPPVPLLDFLDTHMIRLYSPSTLEIQSLASYLWTGNYVTDFSKLWNDPMEALLGLHMLPVQPQTVRENIIIGNTDSGVESNRVYNQFYYIDFGKISVGEYMGTYYDYQPYTKADIYLPYIGVKQLDINEIIGSELWLQYMVDVLSGNCTAMLHVKRIDKKNKNEDLNGILYHWNGSMISQGPLSARDYTEQIKANIGTLVVGVGAIAAGAATGGASAAATAGAVGAVGASGLKAAFTSAPVQHSGNIAGNHGLLGVQQAYVILSRPSVTAPSTVKHDYGLLSQISATIGSMRGYIQMESIHIEGVSCTDAEKDEIEKVLKEGILY